LHISGEEIVSRKFLPFYAALLGDFSVVQPVLTAGNKVLNVSDQTLIE